MNQCEICGKDLPKDNVSDYLCQACYNAIEEEN